MATDGTAGPICIFVLAGRRLGAGTPGGPAAGGPPRSARWRSMLIRASWAIVARTASSAASPMGPKGTQRTGAQKNRMNSLGVRWWPGTSSGACAHAHARMHALFCAEEKQRERWKVARP
eukprot:4106293-Alexandrium_andersonii.AAC.1